jgi:hypothetical protein
MTKTEAHELLNAARAGLDVCEQSITEALMVTGDLTPCARVMHQPGEVTHAVPAFAQDEPRPIKNPRPEVVIPPLPALVFKPFSLEVMA